MAVAFAMAFAMAFSMAFRLDPLPGCRQGRAGSTKTARCICIERFFDLYPVEG
jgi:hypothetical protein